LSQKIHIVLLAFVSCSLLLGHTLGLGHTDEDFENEDLGNCMDYTDNLDANKRPDKSNFETLFDIYGPISLGDERLRQRQLRRDGPQSQSHRTEQHDSHVPITTTTAADASVISAAASDLHPHISAQRLRRQDPSNNKGDANIDIDIANGTTVPDHIRLKKKEAVQKLLERIRNNHSDDDGDDDDHHNHNNNILAGHTHKDGWKLVHRKHHGEEHETDLGEGYKVRVQLLLVH
jgi:hypothetical protein